jgi:hypothetical protein
MIFIHYNNGRVLHGIVLAFGERVVRVAVEDSDDAVEYRLVNQVWVSEDCEVVTMEFTERVAAVGENGSDLLENMIRSQCQPVSLQRIM